MKIKKITLMLITLLLLIGTLTAQEKKQKPTVVIIPFDAKDIEESKMEVLLEVFTNELAGTGKFKVVDRSSIDKIKAEHNFQNSEWSDSDKVAKLGKALNANMVVTGKIMSYEKGLVATFRMLDVNTMEIISPATMEVSNTSDFFDKIPMVVKMLMGDALSTTSSIVYNNKTNGKKYNIGDDGPGGGIIFYYSQSGFDVYEPDGIIKKCHYLEVTKSDLAYVTWCPKKVRKSCCDIETKDGLGYGKINTFKIIKTKHKGGAIVKKNCAALVCHSYSTATTKAGDWFLPNEEELILLKQNLGTRIWASNPINDNYVIMTSHQANDRHVWLIDFTHNSYFKHNKCNSYFVRAIRAF